MAFNGPNPASAAQTFGINNALIPSEGPKCLPYEIDFSLGNVQTLDLTIAFQSRQISLVQTLFVDNSASSVPTSIAIRGTNQTIDAPAFTQGYYAVLVPNPPFFTINNSGTSKIFIFVLNIPVSGSVWGVTGSGTVVTDPILDATVINNAQTTRPISVAPASFSQVTPVATSFTLLPFNASRSYIQFQVPYGTVGSPTSGTGMWFNFRGGACGPFLADCIFLPAGAIYESGTATSQNIITAYDPVGGLEISAIAG